MKMAVISDIHGNLEALRAVIDDIDRRGLDQIICAGDIVGYGPEPEVCIELIQQRCSHVIGGNHDFALGGDFPFDRLNGMAQAALTWSFKNISERSVEYLKSLGKTAEGEGWLMAHGSPKDPEEFIYVYSSPEASEAFEHFSQKICFVGHTHIPQVYALGGNGINREDYEKIDLAGSEKFLVNVGSVGQPRDRDNRACYVEFDSEEMQLKLRRVPYDVKKTMAEICRAGLPTFLADRLMSGQ